MISPCILLTCFVFVFGKTDETCDDLKEKIGLLEADFVEKINQIKSEHEAKLNSLEAKLEFLTRMLEQETRSNETPNKDRRDLGKRKIWDRCPNGTTRYDNSCYIASHQMANWPDALVYCQAFGANLAVIESQREQSFIEGYIKMINASATDPDHFFWIGGTDAVLEGEWHWAMTAEPVTYTKWSPGNPNNDPRSSEKHQDCMSLWHSGTWDDGWCTEQHNFICEIQLDEEIPVIG